MRILVLGSDGRAHALAVAYHKSKKTTRVYVGPGNGLVDFHTENITCLPKVLINDITSVLQAVKNNRIDLVDVSNDEPLALGFVDTLTKIGVFAFGPTQKAAEIEWSKDWARQFMQKYKLPIPQYKSFTNGQDGIKYINSLYSRHSGNPEHVEGASRVDSGQSQNDISVFVKASGLALGKGAIRAENKKDAIKAINAMKQFGKSGETFLIEECLTGEEFSLFAICDGNNYVITKTAQDHKTIYNAGQGPNTGGIGCVAPTNCLTASMIQIIEAKILNPFLQGMKEEERPYSGILYLGGMLTHSTSSGQAEVKIIEFNARWGDPEAQVILPAIKTDYLTLVEKTIDVKLDSFVVKADNYTRVSVAGCARGYPSDYSEVKGKEIYGLETAMKLPGITIFGSGIKRIGKRFFVNGGRIFHLVAEGKDVIEARQKAYEAISLIFIEGNNLHYRTDIGWRDTMRIYTNKK